MMDKHGQRYWWVCISVLSFPSSVFSLRETVGNDTPVGMSISGARTLVFNSIFYKKKLEVFGEFQGQLRKKTRQA